MTKTPPWEAYFGGSFDPIHRGHIHLARVIREQTRFSSLLFVPTWANPLKDEQPGAAAPHRLEMVRRAVDDLWWCGVSPFEIEGERPSYTVDTVSRLIDQGVLIHRPGLVIGDDLVGQLPQWREAERLMDVAVPIVVSRQEGTIELPVVFPVDTVVVRNSPIMVSSTEIRRRRSAGLSIAHLVPEKVHTYIEEHQLYNRSD